MQNIYAIDSKQTPCLSSFSVTSINRTQRKTFVAVLERANETIFQIKFLLLFQFVIPIKQNIQNNIKYNPLLLIYYLHDCQRSTFPKSNIHNIKEC